jgi:5-methylcytosine-specific restriction endonuclease McrA
VRPLVETHWVRMVASLNGITPEEDHLRRHLFGAERSSFPLALRRGLGMLQSGACFYCGGPLVLERSAIDHFIPWTRWPNDAVENLVLAHSPCNGHKSSRVPPAPSRFATGWTGFVCIDPSCAGSRSRRNGARLRIARFL